jgi:hypothetical protein
MKTKFTSTLHAARHSFALICAVVTVLHLCVLGASGQTNKYLYTGSKVSIPLYPGKYNITAYGAEGSYGGDRTRGGLGAKMEGQFVFGTATNLTILVGGIGLTGTGDGGGGGGTFVFGGSTPLVIAGGGGGCNQNTDGGNGLTGTNGDNGKGSWAGGGGSGGYGGGGGQYFFGGGGGGGYIGNGMDNIDEANNGAHDGGYGGKSYIYGGTGGGNFGGNGNNGGFGGGGGGGSIGGGGGGGYSGGGGGGDTGGGGGGGSYIDSSAVAVVNETSGVASPDDSPNGEIIITAVQVQAPSALPLFISSSGKTNTIYWQNEFGWSLQQRVNLTSSSWTAKTTGITTLNGTNYLNVVSPKGNLFFRLVY